jgi:hypothetical protein
MKNSTPTHQRAAGVPSPLSHPLRKSGFALALFAAALAGAILAVAGGAFYPTAAQVAHSSTQVGV